MSELAVSRRGLLLRTVRQTFAQVDDDERLLAEALLLEQVAVASYDAAIAAAGGAAGLRRVHGLPPLRELLRRLREQEREHVEVLASKLEAVGGRASALAGGNGALARARAQAGLRRSLARLRTQEEIAAFAIELENVELARHLSAIEAFQDARLIELMLQIAGAEGQHATGLRRLLTTDPSLLVPGAFEQGTAPPP